MKKILIIGLLAAAAGTGLFARGGNDTTQQDAPYGYGSGPMGGYGRGWNGAPGAQQGPGMMYWTDQDGNPVNAPQYEEVTVEGTLVLETGTHPYIEEAGVKVFLMVPPFAVYDLDLKGGESVQVSGYEIPGGGPMFWNSDDSARFVQVQTAVIDGEELTLQGGMAYGNGAWCGPGAGGGMGRAGGRGPGRW